LDNAISIGRLLIAASWKMVNANPDFDALVGMDILGMGDVYNDRPPRRNLCW
jgi:hypothetical protein